MAELVAINIECEPLGDRDCATVLQIPCDISWQDFVLLVKLHFDFEDIRFLYLDEENDYVSMDREEELREAFRLARNSGNVMNVKVLSDTRPRRPPPPPPPRLDHVQHLLLDAADKPVSLLSTGGGMVEPMVNLVDEEDSQRDRSDRKETVINIDDMETDQQQKDEKKAECSVSLQPPTAPPGGVKKNTEKLQLPIKQKKKELYSQMAREIGHRRKRGVYSRLRQLHNDSQDSEAEWSAEVASSQDEEEPPLWFQRYMDRFRREITDEMASLVTRRVVRQVVSSLDGAVIQSVSGTSGRPAAETKTSATQSQPMETKSSETSTTQQHAKQTVYCHAGIICDGCEQTIVGVRYKCGNCEDFDLCEQCETLEGIHDPEHVFIKIRRPILFAGRRKNGKMSPLFKKSLYQPEESRMREVESFAAFQWEKFQEKVLKKAEKLKRKEEKFAECMIKKEEKLKRRLEQQRETPHKKEKLDIPAGVTMQKMDAMFVKDDTIPDGTRVQPGTRLLKRWVVRNTGNHAFTSRTKLKLMWGNLPPVEPDVSVPALRPGQEGLFAVEHVAPQEPGKYQSHWRLYDGGKRFGHRIWCSVVVDEKEVLEPSTPGGVLNVVTSMQQGEEYFILDDTSNEKNKKDNIGNTPSNYVPVLGKSGLENYEWYFKSITRQEAEELLKSDGNEGCFLVRESTAQLGANTLSLFTNEVPEGLVRHYHIKRTHTEDFCFSDEHCFPTIPELIEYHKHNSGGLEVRLLNSPNPREPATAGFGHAKKEIKLDELEFGGELGFGHFGNTSDVKTTDSVASDVAAALLSEQQRQQDREEELQDGDSGPSEDLTAQDLTPHDLLSFEMLEIRDRSPPEVSQTATPTNTPHDITPPKSPVLGLSDLASRQLSASSSSVELVADGLEDSGASSAEAAALMTELVQERMASLGMKTDEDDIESVSSDDDSDSSDGEFFIVPLPDCFQTDKPINRSTVFPNRTPKTEQVETISDSDNMVYIDDECEEMAAPSGQPEVYVETSDGSIVKSGSESNSAETVIDVDASSDLDQQRAVLAQQLSDEENNNNPDLRGAELGDVQETRGAELDAVQVMPGSELDDVQEIDADESHHEGEMETTPKQAEAGLTRPKTPISPTEVAGNIVNSALNVATHAAATAYTTAKDVLHTLQARNEYVPPRSEWTPKPSKWTPPKDTYTPPKNDWTPPKQTWTPPAAVATHCCPVNPEAAGLDQLFEMGFCNREFNKQLLEKHHNDVERVIQELLSHEDADWFQNRH